MHWLPLAKLDFTLRVKISSFSDPDELSKINYVRGGGLLAFVLWWNYGSVCGCEMEIIWVLLHQQYSCWVHFCSGKAILDTGRADDLIYLAVNPEEQLSAFPRMRNKIRVHFVINQYLLGTFFNVPTEYWWMNLMQIRTSAVLSLVAPTNLSVNALSTKTMWQQDHNLGFEALKCPIGASQMAEQAGLWFLWAACRSAYLSSLLGMEGLLPCQQM